MLDLEIELARATFIIGIGITAFIYERFRLVSGGTITGSYLAFMISIGNVPDVLAWLLLTAVGVATIRLVSHWLPLPKEWLQFLAILVPALIHFGLIQLSVLPYFDEYQMILTAGMYVTNGLTAYDLVRQGVQKTAVGLVAVVSLTV